MFFSVADRDRQSLKKNQRLIAQTWSVNLYSACADEVVQNLVEQDQIRPFASSAMISSRQARYGSHPARA